MKYKKMFVLSVIIAVASAFILPGTEYGFGWPFAWLEYYGHSSITFASELFHPKHFGDVFFHLWNLLFGALFIYTILLLIYKGLNKINKEVEIGEKSR